MKKRNVLIPVIACCLTLTACMTRQEKIEQEERAREQKRIESRYAQAEALGLIWGPNRGSSVQHTNLENNTYCTYTYDKCTSYELYRIENGQQYMTIYKTPTNYYVQTNVPSSCLWAEIDVPADRTSDIEDLVMAIRDKSDDGMSIFFAHESYELSLESGYIVCTYVDSNQNVKRCVLNADMKVEEMTWQDSSLNKSYELQIIYMEAPVEELYTDITAHVSIEDILSFQESIEQVVTE